MTDALRTLALRLLGSRRLSPFGAEIQALSFDAGIRTTANWIVPLAAVAIVGVSIGIGRPAIVESGVPQITGFVVVLLRIVGIDIAIFVFAWLSGWNAARRWRSRPYLIEEIVLTPMRPSHFFHYATTGALAAWTAAIMALLCFDMAHWMSGRFNQGAKWDATEVYAYPFVIGAFLVTLSLSHLESVRLSHACFAGAALPGWRLGQFASRVAARLFTWALTLTALGCMMNWACMAIFQTAFVTLYTDREQLGASAALCSILPLMVITWLKRLLVDAELLGFAERMILLERSGVAECGLPIAPSERENAFVAIQCRHLELAELDESPAATVLWRRNLRLSLASLERRWGVEFEDEEAAVMGDQAGSRH